MNRDLNNKKLFDVTAVIRIDSAMEVYKETGLALIVNDGKYVSVEQEDKQ